MLRCVSTLCSGAASRQLQDPAAARRAKQAAAKHTCCMALSSRAMASAALCWLADLSPSAVLPGRPVPSSSWALCSLSPMRRMCSRKQLSEPSSSVLARSLARASMCSARGCSTAGWTDWDGRSHEGARVGLSCAQTMQEDPSCCPQTGRGFRTKADKPAGDPTC